MDISISLSCLFSFFSLQQTKQEKQKYYGLNLPQNALSSLKTMSNTKTLFPSSRGLSGIPSSASQKFLSKYYFFFSLTKLLPYNRIYNLARLQNRSLHGTREGSRSGKIKLPALYPTKAFVIRRKLYLFLHLQCGSCWAFSGTNPIEFASCKKRGNELILMR